MKKIITFVLICLLLTTNVFAYTNKDAHFEFSTPNGFTEVDLVNIDDEDDAELLELLGHNEQSFKKYVENNNIKYFSLTDDNLKQITIRTYETDFTKALKDMSLVTKEDIEKIADLFLPKAAPYANVRIDNTKYLQTISSGKDSGGIFATVTYVTVKNGLLYTVVFNYPTKNISQALLDESFNTMMGFKIKGQSLNKSWNFMDVLTTIIITLALIAFFILICVVIISLVKDIIKKYKEEKLGEFKVKRRKF